MAASAWTPVDETAAKWTPVDEPKPPQAQQTGIMRGLGDLWDTAKGAGHLLLPPQDDTEKHIGLLGPGPLMLYRMGKGYIEATQKNLDRAKASGDKGDTTGVAINSAAAGLPLVGPLVGGIYEQSGKGDITGDVSLAASRAIQAASMAPEGSSIPNPINAVARPASALLNKAQTLAPEMYRSALKPSPATPIEQSTRAVNTGLQEGIPVSEAGMDKLSKLINQVDERLADEISSRPGAKIDPNKVATRANQIKGQFKNQVNASQDLSDIEASKQQFLSERGAKPGTPAIAPRPTGLLDAQGRPLMSSATPAQPPTKAPLMDAEQAQAMKQGTYMQLGKKSYGELRTASIEAQKALARGIKEELETQFPELHDLNAKLGDYYTLEPMLERAVNRIGNHQLTGIGTPIAAGGLKAITGSTGIAAVGAVLRGVLENPAIKSRLAMMLSRTPGVTYPAALGRVAAYANALSRPESSESPAASPNQ